MGGDDGEEFSNNERRIKPGMKGAHVNESGVRMVESVASRNTSRTPEVGIPTLTHANAFAP